MAARLVQGCRTIMNLVIFTEEPSMKEALRVILPKLDVELRHVRIVSFDGVGNMEKSLPAQLRALSKSGTEKVLILRDNDNGSCTDHKARLQRMTKNANLNAQSKVRIVCQMLEAWFIGDNAALRKSGHLQKSVPKRLVKCDPDALGNPKAELRKLREGYTEIKGAKAIAPHMAVEENRSKSFRHTVQAIRYLT